MPRIIAGNYKGLELNTIKDYEVLRPTLTRAKQVIFDTIQNYIDIDGSVVIDIFAGTGSLGFEAISRGAKKLTLIEKDTKISDILKKSAGLFRNSSSISIVNKDFFELSNLPDPDIIFLDPPYFIDITLEKCLTKLNEIYKKNCNFLIVWQFPKKFLDKEYLKKNKQKKSQAFTTERAVEFATELAMEGVELITAKKVGNSGFYLCRIKK